MNKLLTIIVLTISAVACNNFYDDYHLNVPGYGSNSFVDQCNPLSQAQQSITEGLYTVTKGNQLLGDTLVFKWNKDKLSIFGRRMGIYAITTGGHLDSVLFFQGYWREALSSETGLINLIVNRNSGGGGIVSGDHNTAITINGTYGFGEGSPSTAIQLKLTKRFPNKTKEMRFGVIAHRGGGRTSDKLPVSENTPQMIAFCEHLGANGIEIDTRLSKDDSVMIYHDTDINIRLTQKGPFMGPVQQYTYNQLRSMIRLYHGEVIPTLREMLDYTFHHTNLKFVWIDNKDPETMDKVIPLIIEYNQKAKAEARDMVIVVGMPNKKMMNAYLTHPQHKEVPALCELTVEDVEKTNAMIWGPRWTMGTQNSEVDKVHAMGKLAVLWTLDDPQFMNEFMDQGDFDGILTNYPSLLSYYNYVKICQ